MNQATRIAAPLESASLSTSGHAGLPRRQRLGSAVASVLVTGVLFASVVLGMTSTGDDSRAIVAQSRAGVRA